MNLKPIVIAFYLFGGYLVFLPLFGPAPASDLGFGSLLLAAGFILSRKIAAAGLSGRSTIEPPPVPADFGATH